METFILWLNLNFCSPIIVIWDQCWLYLQFFANILHSKSAIDQKRRWYQKKLDSLLNDPITVEVYNNISTD